MFPDILMLLVFLRWGNTPLDDAAQFGHDVVVSVLKDYLRVLRDKARSEVEKQRSDTGDGEERMMET